MDSLANGVKVFVIDDLCKYFWARTNRCIGTIVINYYILGVTLPLRGGVILFLLLRGVTFIR